MADLGYHNRGRRLGAAFLLVDFTVFLADAFFRGVGLLLPAFDSSAIGLFSLHGILLFALSCHAARARK